MISDPLTLVGCKPEPLMGYLKGLGVFRLVVEQADPNARMSWAGDVCRVHTRLGREDLTDFFLNQYRPTPILAPWNGGSGFYGGGSEPLDAIAESSVGRLALYRDTIKAIRQLIPKAKPRDEDKESLLARCRAALPDEIVPWLDTCFALGEEGPSYFPLLGTGGNDGRLDFTNNFFQRLADVIPFVEGESPPETSPGWLASALFGDDPGLNALGRGAVGQFNPGGIGGANGVQGYFEAGSRVNPWEFVLVIEGALLFAGSVARRLGSNAAPRAVFPFTVESVAVGYGSATAGEETTDGSRAELWLPLWDEPAGFAEIRQLFAEGRAQVGRRQASNAVEFALAACMLGVSRGVEAFTRYGFLKRNGLAFLAAPLGRIAVTPKPAARLLDDPPLARWLDRLRRACRDKEKTPVRYQSALRGVDRGVFEFATRSQTDETADRPALVRVLRALGQAEQTLAVGQSFCEDKYLNPLQGLNPEWLREANSSGDGGREFRLAASLASVIAEDRVRIGPIRTHLEPIEQKKAWVEWNTGSNSAVWSSRPLPDNLATVLSRRWTESEQTNHKGLALRARVFAPLPDIVAFIHGYTDDGLLSDLLWALIALNWSKKGHVYQHFRAPHDTPPPIEFGLMRLVLRPVRLAVEGGRGNERRWQVTRDRNSAALVTEPSAEPFRQLYRGKLREAVTLAARRLWSDRVVPFGWANRRQRRGDYPTDAKLDPTRILAACLFPVSSTTLTRLARQVLSPPVPVN